MRKKQPLHWGQIKSAGLAKQAGILARKLGLNRHHHNPHKVKHLRDAWLEGWDEQEQEFRITAYFKR